MTSQGADLVPHAHAIMLAGLWHNMQTLGRTSWKAALAQPTLEPGKDSWPQAPSALRSGALTLGAGTRSSLHSTLLTLAGGRNSSPGLVALRGQGGHKGLLLGVRWLVMKMTPHLPMSSDPRENHIHSKSHGHVWHLEAPVSTWA